MHCTTILIAATALISSAMAAPRPAGPSVRAAKALAARQYGTVDVTFSGATPEDTSYQTFPLDGSENIVTTDSSISHISLTSTGGFCTFTGVDGVIVSLSGIDTEDVGPPQELVTAVCTYNNDMPVNTPSSGGVSTSAEGQVGGSP